MPTGEKSLTVSSNVWASAGAAKVQARRVQQRRGGEPGVPESGFFVGESAKGANGPRQVTFEPFKKAGKY